MTTYVTRGDSSGTVGTPANTGGTATLAAILGDPSGIDLSKQLSNIGGRMVSKSITLNGATSYPAFTVNGVAAVIVIGVVTGAFTNHANTSSVGTATSAAGLIAATAGTALQTANQIWVDAAPSKFESFPSNWTLVSESIAVTSTANITGGVVSLYCWYIPVTPSSTLVAA